MSKSSYSRPELNAGSMADIAFLLLIFFLVTTTMGSEHGFQRELPAWDDNGPVTPVPEREVFAIHLNGAGQLMVNDEEKELTHLPLLVHDFFSNVEGREDRPRMKLVSTDNGEGQYQALAGKGMVFLQFQQSVPYERYIQVQDGLMAGYALLDVTQAHAHRSYKELNKHVQADALLIKRAREAFPARIAEESVL